MNLETASMCRTEAIGRTVQMAGLGNLQSLRKRYRPISSNPMHGACQIGCRLLQIIVV
jgi:hypothetical protein